MVLFISWIIGEFLTHRIRQIRPLSPKSKWSMGEILAFLAMMMKSGLEKIFLKFLHAITIFYYRTRAIISRSLGQNFLKKPH